MIAIWVGLGLTIYGMGLVFLLLAVLWWMIALLIRLDKPSAEGEEAAASADEETAPAMAEEAAEAGVGPALDPDVLAAIVIACRAHRMSRRKQAAPEMRSHRPGTLPSRWVGTGRTRQNRSWAPGGRFA